MYIIQKPHTHTHTHTHTYYMTHMHTHKLHVHVHVHVLCVMNSTLLPTTRVNYFASLQLYVSLILLAMARCPAYSNASASLAQVGFGSLASQESTISSLAFSASVGYRSSSPASLPNRTPSYREDKSTPTHTCTMSYKVHIYMNVIHVYIYMYMYVCIHAHIHACAVRCGGDEVPRMLIEHRAEKKNSIKVAGTPI